MRKLSPKQQDFCLEYLKCGNASAAYRLIYSCKRMKTVTVNRRATELLANGMIAARLEELRKPIVVKAIASVESVLVRLVAIDNMDICDILNDDWTLKALSTWPEVWRKTLSGIDSKEVFAGQSDASAAKAVLTKIKWPDKLKNLELIGKHITVQAFKEKIEITKKERTVVNVILMQQGDDNVQTIKEIKRIA